MDEAELDAHLWAGKSARKRILYQCACCRAIWPKLNDGRTWEAVHIAELCADELVPESEFRAVASTVTAAWGAFLCEVERDADFRTAQYALLREVIGYPERTAPFQLAWCTSTVLSVAQAMYESRDFGAMPILADALQEGGCDNTDVLDHCRGPGPHVRGCWVVDLVLGNE